MKWRNVTSLRIAALIVGAGVGWLCFAIGVYFLLDAAPDSCG
jgi:hypothetical protein